MATQIQVRRGTAARWVARNIVLAEGEIGVETDAVPIKFKIGDGVTAWNDLDYSGGGGAAADGIVVVPVDNITETDAQAALEEIANPTYDTAPSAFSGPLARDGDGNWTWQVDLTNREYLLDTPITIVGSYWATGKNPGWADLNMSVTITAILPGLDWQSIDYPVDDVRVVSTGDPESYATGTESERFLTSLATDQDLVDLDVAGDIATAVSDHNDLPISEGQAHLSPHGLFGLEPWQDGGAEHMAPGSWPYSVAGAPDELDILVSGKMVGSAGYVDLEGDYNCINIGLGTRVPVNMTEFWVALYPLAVGSYGGNQTSLFTRCGQLLGQSKTFYPPLSTVQGEAHEGDAAYIDPSLSGGLLELYFGLPALAVHLTPGPYMCFIGCVADVTPTVMGRNERAGLGGVYFPFLTAFTDDDVTDTAPTDPLWNPECWGNSTTTGSVLGGRLDSRFYWRIERP